MNDYIGFLLGVICAGLGGELFVRGAVGTARWLRISPGIIATTVVAFATSSPELSVSINAAMAGKPEIALGDALGSNIVNVALILGLALVISGIKSPRSSIKRDFPVALLIPMVTCVLFLDGSLSRLDGLMMLCMFIVWLVVSAVEARKQRSSAEVILGERRPWRVIAASFLGLGFLFLAGSLIVSGAKGIAQSFGMDAFTVGVTIVAIGTSVPELATAVIAKLRGHDEVGLGTILGSNIFNGIFIISIAAIIYPITVPLKDVALTLAFGFVALLLSFPAGDGFISRKRGVLLLLLYLGYIATFF